jgi:hypothetical protein
MKMGTAVSEMFASIKGKAMIWQQIEVGLPLPPSKKIKLPKQQNDERNIFELARVISNRAYSRRRYSRSTSIF